MKNLLDFFFSFDKLFKEKLVAPFFWLALIVAVLAFVAEALDSISLEMLAAVFEFVGFFVELLLILVLIRIIAEIFVAIFRINDNLSPDGGRGELVEIDPVAEARRAAELASARTREMTKSATDNAKTTAKTTPRPTSKSAAAASTMPKSPASANPEAKVDDSKDAPLPVKALEPSSVDGAAVKRGRGRPKGSKNKTKAASASSAAKSTPVIDPKTGEPIKRGRGRPKGSKNKPKVLGPDGKPVTSKPGPKPGTKVRRDADGNLLKKDGTPRKKPGPKPKPDVPGSEGPKPDDAKPSAKND